MPSEFLDMPQALTILDIGNNTIDNIKELTVVTSLRHLVNLNYSGNPFVKKENSDKEAAFFSKLSSLRILNGSSKKRNANN